MANLKDIAATLAILGSGALLMSGCGKDKPATEVPAGDAAAETPAEGSCGAKPEGDAACGEKPAEGEAAPEGEAAADGGGEGSCGGK